MKKVILSFAILGMAAFSVNAQKVHKLNTAEGAKFKAYITSNAAEADLKVFTVSKAEDANKDGLFFNTATAEEADIKYTVTTDKNEADIILINVLTIEEAGWITATKRQLFKVAK